MGKHSLIQWCDGTVNSTTGCDGCELWRLAFKGPCYAGELHEHRMAKTLPALYAPDFTEVRLAPGRMAKTVGWSDLTGRDRPDKPWLNGMPRLIFVGDMGDLFSAAVPFEFIRDEVFAAATSAKGSRHVYMLLTKQPSRMAAFAAWLGEQGIAWPANVWAGTSITSNSRRKRIEHLVRVPAKVRFLSLEPLWEYVDLRAWLKPCTDHFAFGPLYNHGHDEMPFPAINWVIMGGQSDQGKHEAKPFDLGWARQIIRDCRDAGVPAFVKQLGSRAFDEKNGVAGASLPLSEWAEGLVSLRLKDHHGGDWSEWPEDLRVREMPEVAR